MRLPLFIARRYLFAKKSSNAINLITWVSIIGIGVGTAALILVLSVFNGLTQFIENMYSSFDPDVRIVAARGQTFQMSDSLISSVLADEEVEAAVYTLEGRVWYEYSGNQTFGILKGLPADYLDINQLDTTILLGDYTFAPINGVPQAVLGIGLAKFQLNTNLENDIVPISVSYIPQGSRMNTTRDVNTEVFFPSGYFQVQKEYDDRYALTNLEFVQELFEAENEASTIEIKLDDLDHAGRVKERLQAVVGEKYVVQTWYEQHETLYRVMKNEKFVTFMILILMIGILAINIVGALSMIVLEKTKDIAVLKSMGGTSSLVRQVFLGEGLLVGAIGGGIGLSIALIFSFLQLQFGMIELTQGVLLPLKLNLPDFLIVAAAVLGLSFLASIYPSRSAANISVVSGLRS